MGERKGGSGKRHTEKRTERKRENAGLRKRGEREKKEQTKRRIISKQSSATRVSLNTRELKRTSGLDLS